MIPQAEYIWAEAHLRSNPKIAGILRDTAISPARKERLLVIAKYFCVIWKLTYRSCTVAELVTALGYRRADLDRDLTLLQARGIIDLHITPRSPRKSSPRNHYFFLLP